MLIPQPLLQEVPCTLLLSHICSQLYTLLMSGKPLALWGLRIATC